MIKNRYGRISYTATFTFDTSYKLKSRIYSHPLETHFIMFDKDFILQKKACMRMMENKISCYLTLYVLVENIRKLSKGT